MSKQSLSLINTLLDDEVYKAYRGPSKGFNPLAKESKYRAIKNGKAKFEIQDGVFRTLQYSLKEDLDTHEYVLSYKVDKRCKTQTSKILGNFLCLINQRDGLMNLMVDCLIK